MADKITEIIDQAAFDQVSKLKADMKMLADTFVEVYKQAEGFNNALKSAKGIPEYTENAKKSTQATSELEKIIRQLAIAEERLSLIEHEKKKALDAVRVAQQEANAASKDAIKFSNAQEGSLDQLKIKLKQLQAQYSALGAEARKALGPDLLNQVQNTYRSVTQLEKSIGQYSRNVGNYKNETFQLTQVLREVPAFTYSATTGILALSNNLPMLADGFKSVAAATNEATGKVNGAGGALKIFAKSIFSFGNIFTIAIGLLTIFSKEIIGFIAGTDKAAEALEKMREESKGAETEVARLKTTLKLAQDGIIDKTAFLKTYNEVLGSTLGTTNDYNEAEKNTISKADLYLEMVKAKIKMNMALEKALIAKNKAEEVPSYKDAGSWTLMKAQLAKAGGMFSSTKSGGTVGGLMTQIGNGILGLFSDPKEAYDYYYNASQKEAKIAIEAADKAIEDYNKFVSAVDPKTDGPKEKKAKDAKKSGPSMQSIQFARIQSNLDYFKGELSDDQRKAISANLERIKKFAEEQSEINPVEFEWDFQYKLTDFIAKLSPILEGISKAFGAASNIGNEVAGLIADRANAEADQAIRNIDRIEQAQLASLSHLTMSQKKYDEEKKKIEIEADARRKKTERERITAMRKAAEVQKAADIASIISSTAAAIVGMLKNPGGYPGIGLSIAAGITGGLQLARAVNAPLPQYAEGTDDHPGGSFVAGEEGHELITTPDGRSILTPGRATLYPNMPKGTKVTTNEELMQQIYNSAIVKLATGEAVTTSKMEAALIESLDELSSDFKDMKRSVEALKLTVNISGDYSHIAHVKSRVR